MPYYGRFSVHLLRILHREDNMVTHTRRDDSRNERESKITQSTRRKTGTGARAYICYPPTIFCYYFFRLVVFCCYTLYVRNKTFIEGSCLWVFSGTKLTKRFPIYYDFLKRVFWCYLIISGYFLICEIIL